MNNTALRRAVLNLVGLVVSTVPAASCILFYFPLWRERGIGTVISGFALLLLALAAVPLFNFIKRVIKTPSAPFMWFIIFILFLMLSSIADEMTVVAFVGFVSNLIGMIFFRAAGGKENERA